MQKLVIPLILLVALGIMALYQLLIFYSVERLEGRHLLHLGKRRFEAGELRLAAGLFEASLAPPPRDAANPLPGGGEAHYYLGRIAQRVNRPDAALKQHRLAAQTFNRPYLPLRELGYLQEAQLQREQRENPRSGKARTLQKEVRDALGRSLAMNPVDESGRSAGVYALLLADNYHYAALEKIGAGASSAGASSAAAAAELAAAWRYYVQAEFLHVPGDQLPLRAGIFLSNAGFPELALCEFWQLLLAAPAMQADAGPYIEAIIPHAAFPQVQERIYRQLQSAAR